MSRTVINEICIDYANAQAGLFLQPLINLLHPKPQ